MDLNYLSFIDPAFLDIDRSCQDEVEKYLSALPEEDQQDMLILPSQPAIPLTRSEIDEQVEGWLDMYDTSNPQEEIELKQELLQLSASVNLNVDNNQSLKDLRKQLRLQLKDRPAEELLKMGVFGNEITQAYADEHRQFLIIGMTLNIQVAAYNELMHEVGKRPVHEQDAKEKLFAEKFRPLIEMVKAHLRGKVNFN